jgi:hypothetical protein
MQCSILPLQPNKRIGLVIPFHLHLFPGVVIHFPNGIDIPQTKLGLSCRLYSYFDAHPFFHLYIYMKKNKRVMMLDCSAKFEPPMPPAKEARIPLMLNVGTIFGLITCCRQGPTLIPNSDSNKQF